MRGGHSSLIRLLGAHSAKISLNRGPISHRCLQFLGIHSNNLWGNSYMWESRSHIHSATPKSSVDTSIVPYQITLYSLRVIVVLMINPKFSTHNILAYNMWTRKLDFNIPTVLNMEKSNKTLFTTMSTTCTQTLQATQNYIYILFCVWLWYFTSVFGLIVRCFTWMIDWLWDVDYNTTYVCAFWSVKTCIVILLYRVGMDPTLNEVYGGYITMKRLLKKKQEAYAISVSMFQV